jgi:hypothetical protein
MSGAGYIVAGARGGGKRGALLYALGRELRKARGPILVAGDMGAEAIMDVRALAGEHGWSVRRGAQGLWLERLAV